MLLYTKDGTSYAVTDYWVDGGQLHYTMSSGGGGESVMDMDQFDQQRTVDENAKRGVQFVLKPAPNSASPASDSTPTPVVAASADH